MAKHKKTRMEMTKEERIAEERAHLTASIIVEGMSAARKALAQSLIERAAFMRATLEDLEVEIDQNGFTDNYQNGAAQWGTKKSPAVDLYIQMTKNYNSTVKHLNDLAPSPVAGGSVDDGFDDFTESR